jgi:hypothetical protein
MLVPYLLLAIAFLLLGQAIGSGGMFAFFGTLLTQFIWIFPWGILGFVAILGSVGALGLSSRFRALGSLCLCLLAAGSLGVIVFITTSKMGMGQLLFLLPCALVLVYSAWAAVVDWPARRDNAPVA